MNLDLLEALELMKNQVEANQFAIASARDSSKEQDPVNTIGLNGIGLPELVVFGLDVNLATTILVGLAHLQLEQGPLLHDRVITSEIFAEGSDVSLYCVEVLPEHLDIFEMNQLIFPGKPTTAIQIIWPDRDHRWPWDFGSSSSIQKQVGRKPSVAE